MAGYLYPIQFISNGTNLSFLIYYQSNQQVNTSSNKPMNNDTFINNTCLISKITLRENVPIHNTQKNTTSTKKPDVIVAVINSVDK